MAEYSRFFGGTNQYNQADFAEVLKRFFKNGYFPGVDGELAVTQSTPAAMSVAVAAGEGWLQGHWYKNDTVKTVAIPTADPTYPRIDRIVLRLDAVTNLKVSIEVKQGTAQAVPEAPSLTQTSQTYEISLAQVYVSAGATSIVTGNITDERATNKAMPYNVLPTYGGNATGNIILNNGTQIRGKKTDGTDVNIGQVNDQDEVLLGSTTAGVKTKILSPVTPVHQKDGSNVYDLWTAEKAFRGAVANGEYRKQPDGWQECYHKLTFSLSSQISKSMTWTFPAQFLNGAEIYVEGCSSVSQFNVSVTPVDNNSATVTVQHLDGTATSSSFSVRVSAKGRYA